VAVLLSVAASVVLFAASAAPLAAKPARPVPARGATGDVFEAAARQAEEARKAGRREEAVGHYQKALEAKPSWTYGRKQLGKVLYELDRCADAGPHLKKVVAARPKDGTALAVEAICEARLGRHEKALADLGRARSLGIDDAEVHPMAAFHTALLLNRSGNPDAAFEMLRVFANQEIDNPSILVAFGLSVLRLRFLPEELPAEKREMVLLAGRGGYHMARGRRTPIGRLAFDELVSRYPTEPNVHYALGTYLAPEQPDAAIEEFRRELRAAPDHHPSMLQIALIEIKRGKPAEAVPLAEAAVRVASEDPAGRLVLGRALLDAGEAARAVQELEKGATLAPESPEMHFSLARAYQRAGREQDAARAREVFQRLDRAAKERETPAGSNRSTKPDVPARPSNEGGSR
jgi:tetratricopeptide (TPR) repeat protein